MADRAIVVVRRRIRSAWTRHYADEVAASPIGLKEVMEMTRKEIRLTALTTAAG